MLKRQGKPNSELLGRALRSKIQMTAGAEGVLQAAAKRLALTARSYDRILRAARTIADLAGSEDLQESHLAEALTYRRSLV